MTIPETTILPIHADRIKEGGDGLEKYIRDLVKTLQDNYATVVQGVNGEFRSDTDFGNRQWIPTVSGATTTGVGTYTHQTGLVLRQGLTVDCWFDVRWIEHTGTGNLFLDLPYLAAISENNPFVGSIAATNITFTGYLTMDVNPNTRRAPLRGVRSGTTITSIAVTNADTTIRGHLRYVGQGIERN